MAFYADIGDIQTVINRPTQLAILLGDPTGAHPDLVLLAEFIRQATDEIDGILAVKYKTPLLDLISCPLELKTFAIDLIIFRIYENYYRDSTVPSPQTWRRVNALADLKKIASGERMLNISDTDLALITKLDVAGVKMNNRIMNQNILNEYYSGLE